MRKFFFLTCIILSTRHQLHAQDIQLYYDPRYSLNFNRQVPIGFDIITLDKKHLTTKGYLKGKIPWSKLDVRVTGGHIKKGTLYIDSSGKAVDQEKIQFEVYYKKLNIRKTLYLQMRFDGLQVADYKPRQPAERMGRGNRIIGKFLFAVKDGKDGRKGRHGPDGPHLKVILSLRKIEGQDILAADITDKITKRTGTFLINPRKGTLLIRADGADGGNGGAGGDGVDDKTSPSTGGRGGDGGNGGDGGYIEVIVTEETRPFLYCLTLSNEGGKAGEGGNGGAGGQGEGTAKGSEGQEGMSGSPGGNGPRILYTNSSTQR